MDVSDDDCQDDEFIGQKLEYIEPHAYQDCIFCNLKCGKYVNIKSGAWKDVFTLLAKYRATKDVSIINQIISTYERRVRKPADKILQSGICIGKIPYPKLTSNIIIDHCKKFSIRGIMLERFQKLYAKALFLEDGCVVGRYESGQKAINAECSKDLIETIKLMRVIGNDLKNNKY